MAKRRPVSGSYIQPPVVTEAQIADVARSQRNVFEAALRHPIEASGLDYDAIWDQCYDAKHAALSDQHASWEKARTEQVMMLVGFQATLGAPPTAKEIADINSKIVASCVLNPGMLPGGKHP